MSVNGVGWIAAIIIGGLAGWLAEMVMKSNTGIFMNIVLGIVGAVVLVALPQILTVFQEYEHLMLGAIIIVTMIFMRDGIVPTLSRRFTRAGT